jgi:hypothetical protein
MIPRWLVNDRQRTCSACAKRTECRAIPSILAERTLCPLGRHLPAQEAIAARAWPEGVERISGCCDRVD